MDIAKALAAAAISVRFKRAAALAKDWSEDNHPRDERGRFGSGGGGSTPAERVSQARNVRQETRDGLQAAIDKGDLPKDLSVDQQIEIADSFLSQHRAGLEQTVSEIKALAPADSSVKARVKELNSALQKLERKPKYGTVDKLQDGTGVRVVCKNEADVRATVDGLKSNYKVITEDNYIDQPKGAYRSWHLIIEGGDGLQREIQVRTALQDTHSRWAHHIYKPASESEKTAVREHAAEIEAYSKAVSDHFNAMDRGQSSAPPPVP